MPAGLKSPDFQLWEAATIRYSRVKGHPTGIRSLFNSTARLVYKAVIFCAMEITPDW